MAQLRIQLSILVLFPSLPIASPLHSPHQICIHSLEYTHHRTKYPILVSGVRLPLIPSYHHSPPSLLSSINCIFISSQVPCIFDYAPSHSHLIFTTVPSLLFSRVLDWTFGSPLFIVVVESHMLCTRKYKQVYAMSTR